MKRAYEALETGSAVLCSAWTFNPLRCQKKKRITLEMQPFKLEPVTELRFALLRANCFPRGAFKLT